MAGNDGQPNFYHAILPGDALKKTEDAILANDYNVSHNYDVGLLIAPHHGSEINGSNTKIRNFKHDIVVFSAGKAHKHPHKEIVDLYEEHMEDISEQQHSLPRGWRTAITSPDQPAEFDSSYYKHKTTKDVFSTVGSGSIISLIKIPHDETQDITHVLTHGETGISD